MTYLLKTHKILPIFAILSILTELLSTFTVYFNNNHKKNQIVNKKVNHSLMLIFMFIITLSSVLSLQVQEAFAVTAVVATITTGDTAGNSDATTTIDVVFDQRVFVNSGALDGVAVDKQALFDVAGAGAGVGIASAFVIDVDAVTLMTLHVQLQGHRQLL